MYFSDKEALSLPPRFFELVLNSIEDRRQKFNRKAAWTASDERQVIWLDAEEKRTLYWLERVESLWLQN